MSAGDSDVRTIEVIAPINIAIIKYWGKRDEELMMPLNDSMSLTINDLFARTVVRASPKIAEDSISINRSQIDLQKSSRFLRCFAELRRLMRKRTMAERHDSNSVRPDHSKFEITSETNFPIDAGLASSAAGFAAIAFGLGKLYNLNTNDIIRIARLGSGSACRSILSGLVHWKAGLADDGGDCVCETILDQEHWKSLRAIILVTSTKAKDVPSSYGMQQTVLTSKLLQHRLKMVPQQVKRLKNAYRNRNFQEFAAVTMEESGQLHAVCMDTMPPLNYLNENSWHLIKLVHALNNYYKEIKLAYTFDAGPNCCLFMESENVPVVLSAIKKYCNLSQEMIDNICKTTVGKEHPNLSTLLETNEIDLGITNSSAKIKNEKFCSPLKSKFNVVENIFLSDVGDGPLVVSNVDPCVKIV